MSLSIRMLSLLTPVVSSLMPVMNPTSQCPRAYEASQGFESIIEYAAAPCEEKIFDIQVNNETYRVEREFLFKPNTASAWPATNRLAHFCRLSFRQRTSTSLEPMIGTDLPSFSMLRNALEESGDIGHESSLGPDYLGLTAPQADVGKVPDLLWTYHKRRFLNNVQAVDIGGVLENTGSQPEVVVIDNAPSDRTIGWTDRVHDELSRNNHGVAIARILENLLCEQGDANGRCLANIYSQEAIKYSADRQSYTGSLGDLAQAIFEARKQTSDPTKLIINVSSSWVNVLMGGPNPSNPNYSPAASAVYYALSYITCMGGVVVTAVGNRVGAHDRCYESGPGFPAAWGKTEPQLDDHTCQSYFGVGKRGAISSSPVVVSVGATNDQDVPIGLSRPQSNPHYMANGVSAVMATRAGTTTPPVPTAQLSGTSVGVPVVVSAVAILSYVNGVGVQEAEDSLRRPSRSSHEALLVKIAEMLDVNSGISVDLRIERRPNFPNIESTSLRPSFSDSLKCNGRIIVGPSAELTNVCNFLSYNSMDENPQNHPNPNPYGDGQGGLDSTNEILFLTVSEEEQQNRSLEVTQGMTKMIKAVSKHKRVLEVNYITNETEYYVLPDGLSSGLIYQIHLDLVDQVETARLLVINKQKNALTAVEVFVESP